MPTVSKGRLTRAPRGVPLSSVEGDARDHGHGHGHGHGGHSCHYSHDKLGKRLLNCSLNDLEVEVLSDLVDVEDNEILNHSDVLSKRDDENEDEGRHMAGDAKRHGNGDGHGHGHGQHCGSHRLGKRLLNCSANDVEVGVLSDLVDVEDNEILNDSAVLSKRLLNKALNDVEIEVISDLIDVEDNEILNHSDVASK